MREARTHVPGFKPGIAPSQAAVRPHLTGRTFVPLAWVRLIDRPLEQLPAFFHRTGAEIIARDRKGGAQVHFAIRRNRKSTLAAGAFDEGLIGRTGFFWRGCPLVREEFLIDCD